MLHHVLFSLYYSSSYTLLFEPTYVYASVPWCQNKSQALFSPPRQQKCWVACL